MPGIINSIIVIIPTSARAPPTFPAITPETTPTSSIVFYLFAAVSRISVALFLKSAPLSSNDFESNFDWIPPEEGEDLPLMLESSMFLSLKLIFVPFCSPNWFPVPIVEIILTLTIVAFCRDYENS